MLTTPPSGARLGGVSYVSGQARAATRSAGQAGPAWGASPPGAARYAGRWHKGHKGRSTGPRPSVSGIRYPAPGARPPAQGPPCPAPVPGRRRRAPVPGPPVPPAVPGGQLSWPLTSPPHRLRVEVSVASTVRHVNKWNCGLATVPTTRRAISSAVGYGTLRGANPCGPGRGRPCGPVGAR